MSFINPLFFTPAPVEKNWYNTKLQISGHMVSKPGMFHVTTSVLLHQVLKIVGVAQFV
jgi:hypothetical protein